jgi:hypothetical protein
MIDWQPLGDINPQDLTAARLQAHWAAQLVAAPANALLDRREDDSQSNLGWSVRHGALVSRPLPGQLAVGLRLHPLTLLVLGPEENIAAAQPVAGQTLATGLEWLQQALQRQPGGPAAVTLTLRDYAMPAYPVQDGAAFDGADDAALAELTRWFHNGFALVAGAVRNRPGASEARCWPHHFDVGALLVLDPDADAEKARTVGCGWSPGDDTYGEPYCYVNPYPQPDAAKLPAWDGPGHWHTTGFVGAILTGSELLAAGGDQAAVAKAFFKRAIDVELAMLG